MIFGQDGFGSNILHEGLHIDKGIEVFFHTNDKQHNDPLDKLYGIRSKSSDFLDRLGWGLETILQNSS